MKCIKLKYIYILLWKFFFFIEMYINKNKTYYNIHAV